jgi:hypothetical protein
MAGRRCRVRGNDMEEEKPGRTFHPVYLMLLVPFVALLWVPFYDSLEPELFGIPFFYWYQMAWTLLGAVCTLPVYLHEERTKKEEAGK